MSNPVAKAEAMQRAMAAEFQRGTEEGARLAQSGITRALADSLVRGMGAPFAFDVAANLVEILATATARENADGATVYALRMARAMLAAGKAETTGARQEAASPLIVLSGGANGHG